MTLPPPDSAGSPDCHPAPLTDYRVDRHRNQGGDQGDHFIEGGTYCPAHSHAAPKRDQGAPGQLLDTATYRERIKRRTAFQLQVKEIPDAKGRVELRCPAWPRPNGPLIAAPTDPFRRRRFRR